MLERTFTIEINADVERVWQEITRREFPHHAMFGTFLNGELKPGGIISYRNKAGTHAFVLGQVIEVTPPTRLVHTFRFSMEQDAPTLVEWELAPSGKGTKVTVKHSRFEGETRTYKSVSTSWPAILSLYKAIIETGSAPLSARLKNGIMMAMCFMLPKSARAETAMRANMKPPEDTRS